MNTNNKTGGVLVVVMLIMIVLSIITVGMFKLYQDDAVEAVYVDKSSQAFWLAESGLQRALDKLRTVKSFRDDPYTLSESVGTGSYMAGVQKSTISNTWNIVVTGSVDKVSRIISLDPYLYAEVGYALMGLNGDSKLNQFGSIDGNVYNYGELWVNGRAVPSVDGDIMALDGRNIEPIPISGNDKVEMEINSSEWDFSVAGTAPTYITTNEVVFDLLGIPIATNSYKYLDLTDGKTVKVTGNYDLPNDVDGTIGDGTLIVADGDLKFPTTGGSSYNVGAGATIMVDGDMIAKKEGTFEDGVTIYVTGNMTVSKTGTGSTCSFFVEGDFTADMQLDFEGLLFVDGYVQVDGDLNLDGSLIAGDGFWLKSGYDINYNPDYIDQDLLNQMILYVVYATSPGTWNELPSS